MSSYALKFVCLCACVRVSPCFFCFCFLLQCYAHATKIASCPAQSSPPAGAIQLDDNKRQVCDAVS